MISNGPGTTIFNRIISTIQQIKQNIITDNTYINQQCFNQQGLIYGYASVIKIYMRFE